MTDLQWAIVAAAAIVLAGVAAANFRDWSRARRALQHAVPSADELGFQALTERFRDGVLPSELSEAIARLEWEPAVTTERIEQELRGWRHVGSKPLAFGWRGPNQSEASAEPTDGQTAVLEVGVLLATRSGPLHAMEYSEWQEILVRLAGQLGGRLVIPPMSEVLTRARELDQRCARVDAQLTLSVTSNQILSAAAINSASQSAGLEPRGEARFAKGSLHQQRFSVFPGETGNSLILLLDVPRTREPGAAFEEMVSTAQRLASLLEAEVTDESGRRLGPQDFQAIAGQVASKEQELLGLGITPGSAVAQRLFL